jgi:Ca2+-binding EF-hand superfamily protein
MQKIVFTAMIMCFGITFSNAQEKREKQKPPTFSELLKELDKNEDGKLAKAEVKGPLKENFTKIDTNEDGFISKEELEKAPKPERKERKKNK